MLAIVDARMPKDALRELESHAEVLLFSTKGIVYDAISGHPDIFFCKTPNGLVAAPNTPTRFLKKLQDLDVDFMLGKSQLGNAYPQTAHYNAFLGTNCLVHNANITDPIIIDLAGNLEAINTSQGYARCNLVEAGQLFITSDRSIYNALKISGREVFWVSPQNIVLAGMQHGFFGGCAGYVENNLFLVGSLNHRPEGGALAKELEQRGVRVVELHQGPLFDVGSIIFIEAKS